MLFLKKIQTLPKYLKLQFKARLSSHPLISFCNPDEARLLVRCISYQVLFNSYSFTGANPL